MLPGKLSYVLDRLALESDMESARHLHTEATEFLHTTLMQISAWAVVLEKDPQAVKQEVLSYKFEVASELVDKMTRLAENYSSSLLEAPKVMAYTHDVYLSSEVTMQELIASGFRTGHEPVFSRAMGLLGEAQAKFHDRPSDPVESIRLAKQAGDLVSDEVMLCKGRVELHKATNYQLGIFRNQVKDLDSAQSDAALKQKVRELKSICHFDVWQKPIENLGTIPARITQISSMILEANRLNSMEVQKFSEASDLVVQIKGQINSITEDLALIERSHKVQVTARNDAQNRLDEVREKQGTRASFFTHADVSREAHDAYQSTRNQILALHQSYTSGAIGDWVEFELKLYRVVEDAGKAVEQAKEDVRRAQDRRERAERQRLADIEAAESAARIRRSRSSYSSPSSRSGGGGGGGFRGGGGSFGGGGARGKY